jgi:hypothetical protein
MDQLPSCEIITEDADKNLHAFLLQFRDKDVDAVYNLFAPLAAALQGAVAAGLVPGATIRERLMAAEAVLDRARGTVIPADQHADRREKGNDFKARIAALEARQRAEGTWPTGKVHPFPSPRQAG